MKKPMVLFRSGSFCLALIFSFGFAREVRAQSAVETVPVPNEKSDPAQSELLKSFLQVKEQLYATQLAANAADAKARAQTAGIAQQLDAIKTAMVAERERQQGGMQRWQA